MNTQLNALKLALEALESCTPADTSTGHVVWPSYDEQAVKQAITAVKQARALDKMAENARELGLDYEPAPVLYQLPDDLYDSKDWKVGSYAERVEWLHTMYEAKKRELEYCLDAAPYVASQLVQEPVAHQYQSNDGVWRDFIDKRHYESTVEDGTWPIRALYTTPPGGRQSSDCLSNVATPPNETASLAAQDLQTELEATNRQVEILSDELAESRREVAAQRQWLGLTQEEIENCYGGEIDDFARAIEAKLKAKNSP